MVRETRHLWVGNLPDNIREDRIREHFKRYGRVQSVKLLPRMSEEKASEVSMACKVAFMDIKSASKAYNAEIKIDDRTLSMEYCEPVAIPSTASPPQGTPPPFSTSPGNNTRFPNGHGSSDEHGFLDTTTNTTTTRFYDRLSSSSSAGVSRTPPPESFSECSRRLGGGGGSTPISDQPGGPTGLCRGGGGGGGGGSGGNRNRDRFRGGGGGGGSSNGSHRATTGNWSSNYDSPRYNNSNERNHQSTDTTGYNSSSTPSELSEIKRFNNAITNMRHKLGKSKSSGSRSPSLNGSISSQSPSRSRSSSSSPSSSTSRDSSSASSRRSRHQRSHNSKPNQCNNSDDRKLAICVKNLPIRSSDTSLKDGLFHEYKKHGKVTWVKIVGQNADRYAIVCFKKPEDMEKALEVSYNKLFFGCKIEVEPHIVCDHDESEFRYESEIDEYNPKATRTLFIGNLEKDVTRADLRKHFDQFGDIIDIEIKKQGAVSPYAFCQFANIVSVVKAIRKMDGEHLGSNRIKLGFGKSMIDNCVWIDGVNESVNEKYLKMQFEPFGVVNQCVIDHSKGQALIFYEHSSQAQLAVSKMRGFMLKNTKLQVDFANHECQESFFKNLEKQGIVVARLPSEDQRDSTGRNYEANSASRLSRYEATRSRTSSYSNKPIVAAIVLSPPLGNVTPIRSSHYYNYDGTEGRHASHRNYDEYSQGSRASQDEPYDPYEPCGYFHDSPSSHLDQSEAHVTPNLSEPPLPYPCHDIRNLHKERVHLLEQLEDCPSPDDDIVGPKKKLKHTLDPPIPSGGDGLIEVNREHSRKIADARRMQEAQYRHYISRRPSIDNKYGNHAPHNISCKRRRIAGCEGINKSGAHFHYSDHSTDDPEHTGSRPGTPLCDENPDFLPVEPPKRTIRERDGPLNLPLPKFAAQIRDNPDFLKGAITIAGVKGQKEPANPLSSPPPVATSPRVLHHHHNRPPSPTHALVPPPASPPPRAPSLSSSSSDSDLPPPSPSLDERIKSLDEMCQKYEKMSGCRPLPNAATDAPPLLNLTNGKFKLGNKLLNIQNPHEIQPSEIVKSLMAKRSVFDEDLKRLEKVEEKYVPKEFDLISSRLNPSPLPPIITNLPPHDLKVPPTSSQMHHNKMPSTLSPRSTNSYINMPPATRTLQYPFPSHPPATASAAITPHGSGIISSPLTAPQMMTSSTTGTLSSSSSSISSSCSDSMRSTHHQHQHQHQYHDNRLKSFVNTSCDNIRNSNVKSHSVSNCTSSFSETNNNAVKLMSVSEKKTIMRRNSNSTSPRTEFKNSRRNSETYNNVKRIESIQEKVKSVELKSSDAGSGLKEQLPSPPPPPLPPIPSTPATPPTPPSPHVQQEKHEKHPDVASVGKNKEKFDNQKSEKERTKSDQSDKINRDLLESNKLEKEHKGKVDKNVNVERRERDEQKDVVEVERTEKSNVQDDHGHVEHKTDKEMGRENKEFTVEAVVTKDDEIRVTKDRRKSKETDNHDRSNNKHREHHSNTKHKENSSTVSTSSSSSSSSSSSHHSERHHSLPREPKDDNKEYIKQNLEHSEHDKRRQSIKEHKDNNLHDKQKNHTLETKDIVSSLPNVKDRSLAVESRHLSIDSDRSQTLDKRKDRNNSLPAVVGLKRRISSHESLELNDDCNNKRIKLETKKISDRRDSKDSSKNDEKLKKSKHKNSRHNSCDTTISTTSETNDSKHKQKIKDRDDKYKKYKLAKLKSKNKSKDKHFKGLVSGSSSTSSSNDFLVKSSERECKDAKTCKRSEDKERTRKDRSDSKDLVKSLPDDSSKSAKLVDSGRGSKSQAEKHSIFEIDKEDPPYISMYDKVKARSCKNMQKQEEEKRQEKIKAKFSQLKLSRAKREEKKRSTSWDEDSDSDKEKDEKPPLSSSSRRPKKVLSDSSDESQDQRSSALGHRHRLAHSDSESSSIQTSVTTKVEDPDSSDFEIRTKVKHMPIKMSKSRIASDTSDDDDDYEKNRHHEHINKIKKESSSILSEVETEQDDSRDVIKTSEKITSVKCEIEKLVKKERRNSKLQEYQSGEFQTMDLLHSEPAEVKLEKPSMVSVYHMTTSDDNDITKKEKFDRREKKHRKKLKKQKHSISIENSFKTDPEIVKTDTPERNPHFEKKRSHSKKDKRRDKTKDRKEKYKKSKKNKFEGKSISKREGKMENIFGSLSEDSECESKENNSCVSEKYIEEPMPTRYPNSPGYSDDEIHVIPVSLNKDNEHKRKKEKKRKEKRFHESVLHRESAQARPIIEELPISNENSMDFIDMGKQLEANIKDDISEMDYRIEDSEGISYDTSVTYNYTDNEVKKEKDDIRESKEKKKKRKKSKDEKRHHFHHSDKTKRKSSDAKSEKIFSTNCNKFTENVTTSVESGKDRSSPDSQDSNQFTFHNKQTSHSLPNLLEQSTSSTSNVSSSHFPNIDETEHAPIIKSKKDKLIPGFGLKIDETIHENAVKSICTELESDLKVKNETIRKDLIVHSKSDNSSDSIEDKSRVVISQAETEDAVAALLEESFGTSQFKENYTDDIIISETIGEEISETNTVQDDEEMRQAVQSLEANELNKPDTPQSEHELQIDTDTEEPEDSTSDNQLKILEEPIPFSKAKAEEVEEGEKVEAAGLTEKMEAAGEAEKVEAAGLGEKEESAGLAEKMEAAGLAKKMEAAGLAEKMESSGLAKKMEAAGLAEKMEAAGLAKKMEAAGLAEKMEAAGLAKKMEAAGLAEKMEAAGLAEKMEAAGLAKKMEAAGLAEKMEAAGETEKVEEAAEVKEENNVVSHVAQPKNSVLPEKVWYADDTVQTDSNPPLITMSPSPPPPPSPRPPSPRPPPPLPPSSLAAPLPIINTAAQVKETWVSQHTDIIPQNHNIPATVSVVSSQPLVKSTVIEPPTVEVKSTTSVIQLHNLPALSPVQLCNKPTVTSAVVTISNSGASNPISVVQSKPLSASPQLQPQSSPSNLHLQRLPIKSVMVCKPLQTTAVFLPQPQQVRFSVPASTFHHHSPSPDRSFMVPGHQPLYASNTSTIKSTLAQHSHAHIYHKNLNEQSQSQTIGVETVISGPSNAPTPVNVSKAAMLSTPFMPITNLKVVPPVQYKFTHPPCSTPPPPTVQESLPVSSPKSVSIFSPKQIFKLPSVVTSPPSQAQQQPQPPPPPTILEPLSVTLQKQQSIFSPQQIFNSPTVISSTIHCSPNNVRSSKLIPEDLSKPINGESKPLYTDRTCVPGSIENVRRTSLSSPIVISESEHVQLETDSNVKSESGSNQSVLICSYAKHEAKQEDNIDSNVVVKNDEPEQKEGIATNQSESVNQGEVKSEERSSNKIPPTDAVSPGHKKCNDSWLVDGGISNSVIKTLPTHDLSKESESSKSITTTDENTPADNSQLKLNDEIKTPAKVDSMSTENLYKSVDDSSPKLTNVETPRKGRGGRPKGSKTKTTTNRSGVQTRRGKLKEIPQTPQHPAGGAKRGRKAKVRKLDLSDGIGIKNDITDVANSVTIYDATNTTPNDVYAFTEELEDATSTSTSSTSNVTTPSTPTTPSSSKEHSNNVTSRFVLTVRKSTLDKSNSQATATIKEITKDGTFELLNDTKDSASYKTVAEQKAGDIQKTNSTRKSKRLQEKDTSKNAVDNTIEDVIKNVPLTRGSGGSSPATAAATNQRRSNRQIKKPQPLHAEQDLPKKAKNKGKRAQRKNSDSGSSTESPTKELHLPQQNVKYEGVAANILEKAAPTETNVEKTNTTEHLQIECVRKTTDVCPPKTAMLKRYNASQPSEVTTSATEYQRTISTDETNSATTFPVTPTVEKPAVVEAPIAHDLAECHPIEKPHDVKSNEQQRSQASVVIQRPAPALAPPLQIPVQQQQQPQQHQPVLNIQQYPVPLNNALSVKNVAVGDHPIKSQVAVVSPQVYQSPITQMAPSVQNIRNAVHPSGVRPGPPAMRPNPNIQGVGPSSPLAATASKCAPVKIPASSPHQQQQQQQQPSPMNSEEKYLLQAAYDQRNKHLSQLKHGQEHLVSIGSKAAITTPVLTRDIPVSSPTGGKGYGVIQNAVTAVVAHQQHSNPAAISLKNSSMDLSNTILRSTNLRSTGAPLLTKPTYDIGEDSIYSERNKSPPPAHQNSPRSAKGEPMTRLPSGAMPSLNPSHYMMSHLPHQKLMPYHLMDSRHARPTSMETFGAECEEAPILLSGRMAAVPRHSPHDRSTESPAKAQIYNAIPPSHHSNYHPNFYNQYTETPKPSPPQPPPPPPTHRLSNMPPDRANLPTHAGDRLLAPFTANTFSHLMADRSMAMPPRPPEAHSGQHGIAQNISNRQHTQYSTRIPFRESNENFMAAHMTGETPTSQREIQVATPPVASQVPPHQIEGLYSAVLEVRTQNQVEDPVFSAVMFLRQHYELIWQGQLALKTDLASVQMYFISGNRDIVDCLPKYHNGTTPLIRISQRMRLEPPQIEGVVKKMQFESEYCMLLALPCGASHRDVASQSANLVSGFIKYLMDKQAAGIINFPASGTSEPAAYVVHVFPKCDFTEETLNRIAPTVLQRTGGISSLVVIITTV